MRRTPRPNTPAALRLLLPLLGLLAPSAIPQTSADEAKTKEMLSHLTLQEEIRLLSGSGMMTTTATILATGPSIESRIFCKGASQGMPEPAA